MARNAFADDTAIPAPLPAENSSVIPVGSIHSLRQSFPGRKLIFEIDLAVTDCWDGLEYLAAAFRQAGVRLRLLRCTQSGVISCTVVDGGADLGQLAASLTPGHGIAIAGWTTRIHYE